MQITLKHATYLFQEIAPPVLLVSQLLSLEGCSVSIVIPHLYGHRRTLDSFEIRTIRVVQVKNFSVMENHNLFTS